MRRCLLSILVWTIAASAQVPAGVPDCAKGAVDSAIHGSGCAATDIHCLCASENLVWAIESANYFCDAAEQGKLHAVVDSLCDNAALQARDVTEDDEDDTPSPTVASEGTDQATLETPVVASTPTVASEGTDQATLGTPVVANTPTIASEGTDQATLGTPVFANTPTIASEGTDQATFSTPTVIAAPKTPLPPNAATSIVTDTREFSHPIHSSPNDSVVTTQQPGDDPSGLTSATTTSPDPRSTALIPDSGINSSTTSSGGLLGQRPSSVTGEAVSEVAVNFGVLGLAVLWLTWVVVEF